MNLLADYCTTWILVIFCMGYLLIIAEHKSKINKAATALFMAGLCWGLYAFCAQKHLTHSLEAFRDHFEQTAEIVFFLLGAMAIVELIDSHQGFKRITDCITIRSKRMLLWLTAFLGFFLSVILGNLTSTIVMISLIRKLIPDKQEQMLYGGLIVIATNAGGVWAPIGDITTTMLWINGRVSSLGIIGALFLPSVVCLALPLAVQSLFLKGHFPPIKQEAAAEPVDWHATLLLYLGIGALLFVPIFKGLTGLPPFVGMLLGVGVLWFVSDCLHRREDHAHLRMPHILRKIDLPGVLFFLGILMAVNALEVVGLLRESAHWLNSTVGSLPAIAYLIGIFSAIVDNVPLVAATMGMYDLATYPIDHPFWQMIAYVAGTGGSVLIIGSAAGIAYMGMEKVDFGWYFRRISGLAFLGYTAGFLVYLLM